MIFLYQLIKYKSILPESSGRIDSHWAVKVNDCVYHLMINHNEKIIFSVSPYKQSDSKQESFKGTTTMDEDEINRYSKMISINYIGDGYDQYSNNCQKFAQDLVNIIVKEPVGRESDLYGTFKSFKNIGYTILVIGFGALIYFTYKNFKDTKLLFQALNGYGYYLADISHSINILSKDSPEKELLKNINNNFKDLLMFKTNIS